MNMDPQNRNRICFKPLYSGAQKGSNDKKPKKQTTTSYPVPLFFNEMKKMSKYMSTVNRRGVDNFTYCNR